MEVNLPFLLCFTLYLRVIFQVQAPQGAYIWRGNLIENFLRYPFEGLIFGGAYLRKEICASKLIGLALWLEVNLPFLLCFTLYLENFLRYPFEGLIFGGLIFGILWYIVGLDSLFTKI